jgi:hypothetical protein
MALLHPRSADMAQRPALSPALVAISPILHGTDSQDAFKPPAQQTGTAGCRWTEAGLAGQAAALTFSLHNRWGHDHIAQGHLSSRRARRIAIHV